MPSTLGAQAIEFLSHVEVPKLPTETLNQLTSNMHYEANNFIYADSKGIKKPDRVQDLAGDVEAQLVIYDNTVKDTATFISFVANQLRVAFEQKAKALKLLQNKQVFSVNEAFSEVQIYIPTPEEYLVFNDNLEEYFIADLEEYAANVSADVDIHEFWNTWHAEDKPYIYSWVKDPENFLGSVLQVRTDLRKALDPKHIAYLYVEAYGD